MYAIGIDGAFAAGVFAMRGPDLSERFPTSIRATGMESGDNTDKSLDALSIAAAATAQGLCKAGAVFIRAQR